MTIPTGIHLRDALYVNIHINSFYKSYVDINFINHRKKPLFFIEIRLGWDEHPSSSIKSIFLSSTKVPERLSYAATNDKLNELI